MRDGKPTAVPGIRQSSRFDTLWRKVFSVRGATPEVSPHFELSTQTSDLAFHAGWKRFAEAISVTGDATHKGQILFQIAQPNILCTLERLEVYYTPATLGNPIYAGWGANAAGGAVGKPLDQRQAIADRGSLLISTFGASADLLSNRWTVDALAQPVAGSTIHQVILVRAEEVVLVAGQSVASFGIETFANNETMRARVIYRERSLEDSELRQG